jgi:hypothetical protein
MEQHAADELIRGSPIPGAYRSYTRRFLYFLFLLLLRYPLSYGWATTPAS